MQSDKGDVLRQRLSNEVSLGVVKNLDISKFLSLRHAQSACHLPRQREEKDLIDSLEKGCLPYIPARLKCSSRIPSTSSQIGFRLQVLQSKLTLFIMWLSVSVTAWVFAAIFSSFA